MAFYEYFHGDNGEGLGASHHTGWTGLAGRFVQALHMDPQQTLQSGARLVPKREATKSKTVGLQSRCLARADSRASGKNSHLSFRTESA
jgi:hypothetical protein